ncbi:MAG: radical SAM protein [Candidatus Omnitrophica bacterium]|nr:radical SAM protein [Candidatus Omnitrophota bacterium]MDD5552830.1 radical SAM protein [Candidatus Omnitrophota bacterium]
MREFKVQLISPPFLYSDLLYNNIPLPYGLGVLAGFLKKNKYNVTLGNFSEKIEEFNRKLPLFSNSKINVNILRRDGEIIDYISGKSKNRDIDDFIGRIIQISDDCGKFDLIGIPVMSYHNFLFAALLAKKLKSVTGAKTVVGGPFISIHGEEFFSRFPFVDYMVVGDGQVPLTRLIEHLTGGIPIQEVPNLIYRQSGRVGANPKKLFSIEDIDIPDFSGLRLDFYKSRLQDAGSLNLPYQISRGCIYNCNFCKRRTLHSSVEFKSHDKVISEIALMKERYGNNCFHFCDDTINCSYDYLEKLCDTFIEKGINIFWKASARVDNLDRKILKKMKKAGCASLWFGIESGSDRMLSRMGKDFNAELASSVLRYSYEAGIRAGIHIIAGFPHEEEKDVIDTTEFIRKNSKYIDNILSVTSLRLEYATNLYNDPQKFGIENLRPVYDIHRRCFAFDEINGLRWRDKLKQQLHSRKKVMEANFKYLLPKKYRIRFMPFWLYFFIKERLHMLNSYWLSRLFKLSSGHFIKIGQ